MEIDTDLLINMAGWWNTEEFRKMEFLIPIIPQNLCPSVWSVDLDPKINRMVSDRFFDLLA